jgi:hypothetical protein
MPFEEHPDVLAFRRVEERQDCGVDCPDCLRSAGHLLNCKILKRYQAAKGISITLEDFNELRLDRSTVEAILETPVTEATRQACQNEMEQGRKCGWKFLEK